MPKNIVICCDGTGNEVAGHPTNVLNLFRMLVRNEGQLAYYDGGVGTLSDPTSMTWLKKWIRLKLDGAIGNSLRGNFGHAYQFLATHYQPGDQIYLFGFSRGAYTVRALAGAIHRFGILRPELVGLSDFAWSSYSNEMKRQADDEVFQIAARFKGNFAVEKQTPIRFVGVFDTVSSLGWIWDYRSLPNTARNSSVEHVRHAMAIDEHRALFPVNRFIVDPERPFKSCKEVWFAGVHSDVGGGYPDEQAGLAKLALEWMVREAEAQDLAVDADTRDYLLGRAKRHGKQLSPPDAMGPLHDSLTGIWNLLEMCPRRAWNRERDRMAWHAPNFWRRRSIDEGPCVHQSVLVRAQQDGGYSPPFLKGDHDVET
jgi:uncharacterized protein (DUF2235 family)